MAIYVPLVGSFLDINEMIVVFCIIIVAYLAVMHIEFRQLRLISQKYSNEETELSRCIKDLKTEMTELSDVIHNREIKKISNHVSGTSAAKGKDAAADSKESVSEASAASDTDKKSDDSKELSADDTKSLQDMLDKV